MDFERHLQPWGLSFERLLTLDFGGGTLDFCILQREGESFQILATHGVALGGDKIDQTIFREVIFPLLGKGERWSRIVDGESVDTLFPFSEFEELLLNWPVSYILNQNKYTALRHAALRQWLGSGPGFTGTAGRGVCWDGRPAQ